MSVGQVKSRQRVSDHGEVYTNPREVNAMLDLVKNETERIDSRFLEPACGHGNFLAQILERKLDVLSKTYGRSRDEFESYGVIAVGSIYGIDLLQDNVDEARERVLGKFADRYLSLFKTEVDACLLETIRFILNRNIIVGDALELKTKEGEPIVFSEWSMVVFGMIKRRDYSFEHLVANIPLDGLFSDLGEDAFIQTPVAEFPPIHYLKLVEQEAATRH